MNNNDDHARMYKYVPGSILGASIIIAVVIHYFFPIMTVVVIPFPYNLLGLLIVGLGVYLAFQSVRLLISHNTTVEAGGNPSSLVTQCPYNYSRNPIYLGFLLITVGTAIVLSSLTAFLAPVIFYLAVNRVVIPFEEKKLQRIFGIDYEEYKRAVQRWM
jgi:protein-S-isoprenylcysteine O-methyltransferase Ste14